MKLAVVTPRYGVEVPGGAETAARLLATRLATRPGLHGRGAHHVRARRGDVGRSLPERATTEIDGVRVHRFPVDRPAVAPTSTRAPISSSAAAGA